MTADIHQPSAERAIGFVVHLPEPPGTNDLHMPVLRWRNGKPYARMIRTPEYDAWRTEAGLKLNRQETEQINGRFAIDIVLTDAGGSCDSDAVLKATLDLLVKHRLITDDNRRLQRHCAVDVWGAKQDAIDKGNMQVRVRALPEPLERIGGGA